MNSRRIWIYWCVDLLILLLIPKMFLRNAWMKFLSKALCGLLPLETPSIFCPEIPPKFPPRIMSPWINYPKTISSAIRSSPKGNLKQFLKFLSWMTLKFLLYSSISFSRHLSQKSHAGEIALPKKIVGFPHGRQPEGINEEIIE